MTAESIPIEIAQAFVDESRGLLENAATAIESLTGSREPRRGELLENIERAFHTVGGAAGWLGLERIAAIGRGAERLTRWIRGGRRALDERALFGLTEAVVLLVAHVLYVESRGAESERDGRELLEELDALTDGERPRALRAVR